MTRDPRVDPRKGDVVRCPEWWLPVTREVTAVWEDGTVEYAVGRFGYNATPEEWRTRSAAAEVVTVAGEVTT